jgi:hypothetical protein
MMPQTVPPVPPKAEPVAEPASSGRRWVIPAAIGTGVVVVGAVAAFALGGGGDDPAPPVTTNPPANTNTTDGAAVPVSAQGISLSVPAGWSDGGDAPQVPGLAAGAVTMGGPKGGAIIFGQADKTAANSTLLADDLRAAAGTLPEKTVVEIGDGAQAARYGQISLGGGKTATVYAVPTSNGVATLACTAEDATCDEIAGSMKITEGDVFGVGPSQEYGLAAQGGQEARHAGRGHRGPRGRLHRRGPLAQQALRQPGRHAAQRAARRVAAHHRRRIQEGGRRGPRQGSRRLQA